MTTPTAPDYDGLIERLEGGPHEWGYRDPVEGGFIEDDTPFEAAAAIRELVAERDEAVSLLRSLFEDGPLQLHLGGNPRAIDAFVERSRAFLGAVENVGGAGQ